ncbi:MAG: T9SS type A sorting domain-containing protein, partial [Saprospiraceae bacterium]|nr:T9SS type A sorting domain-containing protein [Saprospiraceae bacterium]
PGSSGSPIFSDATKRAMGFLSGGGAACGNDLSDWYGSISYSWNNNSASDSRRRLRDHLDPGNVANFVDGSANPCGPTPPGPCTGTTYSSAANLNLAIPDNTPAGVSSTITVATSGTVTELKCVSVNLAHTWTGDLVATLTHVSSGTSVQLFRRLNATTPTAVGESSNLSGAYTFCATGASFAVAGNGGLTDYTIPPGTYAQSSVSVQLTPPQNANTFANFVGLALNGQWRLTVSDYSADDIGTLSSWSFEACSSGSTCPTFSGAPANVTVVNSTCNSGTVSGGSITAPAGTPCPAGSTLQYNVNDTGWTTTLPGYNQTGPVQNIKTRCSCDSDPNMVSTESSIVTTIPGSCAPANDLCANATPIGCGTTISSSNINATAEPGSFLPCGVVQTTAGVWYTFTGTGGSVTLSTCSAASFDTKISVYTGGCTSPSCVAGNDDACPGARSSITFTTTNGTVYLVLIHGFGGATGTFDLTLSCTAPCPTFSGAPANVSIEDSSCGSGCTLTGGSITAPAGTPCPAGSTLQYNVNNIGWTTTLPDYNQAGPVQTIRTRCSCNTDANNVSAESNPVSTMPGTLANPVVPVNGSAIVACPALATQPTPPTVTACNGSVITPSGPSIVNTPNPLTCEGTRTYTWTYACGSTSSTWSFVYTIERNPFTVPTNGAATVNNPALATQPVPPMVSSACGETLTPSGPIVTNSPDPVTCTGTRTYTWTYTDCENNMATWSFVYTIIDNTPPTVTAGSIAACYPTVAAAQAAALAATSATDNCSGTLTETVATTGTCSAVVTVTTTDANSNAASVTYNTRIDNTPPTLVCKNSTVFLGGNGSYTLTQADVFNAGASSDNCPGTLTVTNILPATVNCSQLNQTIPVTVTVQDGCGNVATCTAQITVQVGTALPSGWSTGNTGTGSGSAGYNPCVPGGQFTVASTGFISSLTGEAIQEAYQNICGNTTITVRVAGLTGGGWAGITLRESLASGSKMVALKTQLTNSVRREHRSVTNGLKTTQTLPLPQIAEWLRIQRSGNIFTFSVSPNGINWSPAGTVTLALNNCLLVGLFAESINVNTTTTAVFGNVTISGGVAPLAGDTSNGVDEATHQQPEFSVYPNPTTGVVTVDLSGYAFRETVRLQVFNTNGQPIHNLELNNLETATQRLDLSTLPNGVYLIRIQSDGLPDAISRVVLHSGGYGK